MTAPDDVMALASRLGFDVTAWGEIEGVVDGNGEVFVGVHREIDVFLRAWAASRDVVTGELARDMVSQGVIPIVSGLAIYANTEATITVRPVASAFVGRRLAISDRMAGLFDVLDVSVGNRSIFTTRSPIPGFMFAARVDDWPTLILRSSTIELSRLALSHLGRPLPFGLCQIGEDIRITVLARPEVGDGGIEFDSVVVGELIGDVMRTR